MRPSDRQSARRRTHNEPPNVLEARRHALAEQLRRTEDAIADAEGRITALDASVPDLRDDRLVELAAGSLANMRTILAIFREHRRALTDRLRRIAP